MESLALVLAAAACVGVALLWNGQRRVRRRQRQLDERTRGLSRRLEVAARAAAERESAECLTRAGREARWPVRFTSGSGEDLFLWRLFEDKLEGRFIEVGAYDGVTHSVTYPFEGLGWTGVLIEPLPEAAAACRAARAHSRTVQAALGPVGSGGTARFTKVGGDARGEKMSFLTTSARHRKIMRERGEQVEIEVPLTTMDAVLDGEAPGIDFAVIDVEGGEAELLRGFDLRKHRPRVLVIEDKSDGADGTVPGLVMGSGYVCAGWVGENLVFVTADEQGLVERAVGLCDRPAPRALSAGTLRA